MPPDPAVAAVRVAVREVVCAQPPGALLVAACSGGADSLALLAALVHECRHHGRRSGAVHVDHGLDDASPARAGAVRDQAKALGADVVEVVAPPADDGPGGPEAQARRQRYAALAAAAERVGARVVLLGHTLDDQAETVLLGLARGSGARSLAGMAAARGVYRRPLLGVPRATTHAACAALGLAVQDDPANTDAAYARNRVRHAALPALEAALGPGVAVALARSAELLRSDADLLDELAADAAGLVSLAPEAGELGALDVDRLAALPAALRSRVLRAAAVAAGSPGGTLARTQVAAMDRLVTAWHGQGAVALPGGLAALRRCARLVVVPSELRKSPLD